MIPPSLFIFYCYQKGHLFEDFCSFCLTLSYLVAIAGILCTWLVPDDYNMSQVGAARGRDRVQHLWPGPARGAGRAAAHACRRSKSGCIARVEGVVRGWHLCEGEAGRQQRAYAVLAARWRAWEPRHLQWQPPAPLVPHARSPSACMHA